MAGAPGARRFEEFKGTTRSLRRTLRGSASPARRRFAVLLTAGLGWALIELLHRALPAELIALAVLVIVFAATAHAVVIALYLRLVRRVARSLRLGTTSSVVASSVVVAGMGATYWESAAADGVLRQLAVAAVFGLGLCVYTARVELARELRLRARIRRER
jgi:hypothetical protein